MKRNEIEKYHKSLMRQTPKNPPVQKEFAFSTKLGIVNSKQRASNLTDPYQKKKKQTRQGSICQTSEPGIPQATSLQELTIRKFSLLPRRDSKNRAVQTVKVSKFPHKSDRPPPTQPLPKTAMPLTGSTVASPLEIKGQQCMKFTFSQGLLKTRCYPRPKISLFTSPEQD